MKATLLILFAAMATALLLAFGLQKKSFTLSAKNNNRDYPGRTIISCSPDWNILKSWIEEVDVPPLPGSGKYEWKINTKHDSAQFYFNQGINTFYGFHIIEAMASFKKAARFDSACAMTYWAQALAYGPNINDLGYAASPEALAASKKADELSANATEKEKMLIQAQLVRYSPNATASRENLNQLYADKMKEMYEKFPGDADIAALYTDALMLQHPWDLWKNDGSPKPWTPRIRQVLEKLLTQSPEHPGANHYYIHVMEPSPFPSKALPSADRLGKLAPGVSHLVHMPSHIYLRTGNYRKGALVNENAVNSYKKYVELFAPVAGNDFLYVIHNLHMQSNHAMFSGNAEYSAKSAGETSKSIPTDYLSMPAPLGNYLQYIFMTPVLSNVRYGKWVELLAMETPPESQVFSTILYHFGKGMAFTHYSKIKEAKNELELLQQQLKDSSLLVPMSPFSPLIMSAIVAEQMLAGTIFLAEKKYSEAIDSYTKAVDTEENMVYNEPRDWLLNPKHYLGNAYLRAGKFAKAKQVFKKDLKNNEENGWALIGLYKALTGEKNKVEAEKIFTRYKKSFTGADIILKEPVQL